MWDVKRKVVTADQVVFSPRGAQEVRGRYFDGNSVTSQQDIEHFSNRGSISEIPLLRLTVGGGFFGYRKVRIFIEMNVMLVKAVLKRSKIHLHMGVLGPDDQVYVAYRDYHLQCHLAAYSHPAGLRRLRPDLPDFHLRNMRPRMRNWPGLKTSGTTAGFVSDIWLQTATTVLCGAWHLTVWNGPFRIAVKGIPLWKISAIGVASSFILEETLVFLALLPYVFEGLWDPIIVDFQQKCNASMTLDPLFEYSGYGVPLVIYLLGGTTCCFLIFSRTYLVVESFISVAFVPDAVFAVPK